MFKPSFGYVKSFLGEMKRRAGLAVLGTAPPNSWSLPLVHKLRLQAGVGNQVYLGDLQVGA